MRYAVCLRGIHYRENHIYNEQYNQPYTIDFTDGLALCKQNLIECFREKGHEVDIYISTYCSKKLVDLYMGFSPKKIKLRDFQDVPPGTYNTIYNGSIDCLEMVYESGIEYDFILLTRLDLLWLQNMSSIYFAPNAISATSPGDDNITVISGDLLGHFLDHYKWMRENRYSNHEYLHRFHQKGYRIHLFHSTEANSLFRCARQCYVPKDHPFYLCCAEELFNPKSKYYALQHKTTTEFFSIDDYKP